MHHHLRSAPSPPASPGTSIRRFYASGLIEAAEAGQLDEVEQALSRGIPVNSQTKHGTTALMKACEKGHLDITRKLLAAGADAAVTNHFGETAATLAASSNQPEAGLGWRPPRLRSTSSRSEAHAPRNFLASSFSKLKLYFAAT